MPNIKSQKDRVVQAAAEQAHNKAIKTNLKTVVKKADAAIDANAADKDATVLAAVSAIDKARAKGVIKKNTRFSQDQPYGQACKQERLIYDRSSDRLTNKTSVSGTRYGGFCFFQQLFRGQGRGLLCQRPERPACSTAAASTSPGQSTAGYVRASLPGRNTAAAQSTRRSSPPIRSLQGSRA